MNIGDRRAFTSILDMRYALYSNWLIFQLNQDNPLESV